jgi:hypothetical protein
MHYPSVLFTARFIDKYRQYGLSKTLTRFVRYYFSEVVTLMLGNNANSCGLVILVHVSSILRQYLRHREIMTLFLKTPSEEVLVKNQENK